LESAWFQPSNLRSGLNLGQCVISWFQAFAFTNASCAAYAAVLPEYCNQQTDEEGISRCAFDLIFAFDEVISLGHKENVTLTQVKTFTEMESHEVGGRLCTSCVQL
jgi:hypothetical protein